MYFKQSKPNLNVLEVRGALRKNKIYLKIRNIVYLNF